MPANEYFSATYRLCRVASYYDLVPTVHYSLENNWQLVCIPQFVVREHTDLLAAAAF